MMRYLQPAIKKESALSSRRIKSSRLFKYREMMDVMMTMQRDDHDIDFAILGIVVTLVVSSSNSSSSNKNAISSPAW